MAIGLSNHELYPRVVRCGCPQTVSIVPVGEVAKFNDEWVYNIGIVPTACSEETYIEHERMTNIIKVKPENGVITFTYTFEDEQEWALLLAPEIYPNSIRKYSIYSLEDDLYERTPYKGDLHAHSNSSDGNEEPCIVAANYRKMGFDFFALTDPGTREPSEEMIATYSGVKLGMKLFPGEEVHIPNGWIHIVHFGGNYSVNTLYRENKAEIDEKVAREAEKLDTPPNVNPLEYAYRKWIYEEIHRAGGFAITAHPNWYWRTYYSYNMCDKMLEEVFRTGIYDAFELIGGQSVHENNMQIAFYQDMRADGVKIPIVGSSDSHGTDPASYFGIGRTVVFAKDMEYGSITDAIKNHMSVALEREVGEKERVHGTYRLVKYTRFLLDYYFPAHDEMCIEEGRLMREYALGSTEAGAALTALAPRVEKNMNYILRGK